ncbi:MAG: PilZ domain-containing protein [Fimbriimonadaceae bacterium]
MKRFLNTRATIDRVSEGSIWHGWVHSINAHEVRIQSADPPSMMALEVCELHLATARYRADFMAEFKLKMGSVVAFAMPPRVRVENSTDPFRVQLPNLPGRVRTPQGEVAIQVLDASLSGLAFEIEQPVEPGEWVEVEFESCCGAIGAGGQIVYCAAGGEAKPCRVGMKIDTISRISRAKLDRLVSAGAA